jgi:site-specific DNA-methyltransferase (cytosine-N4-specific)
MKLLKLFAEKEANLEINNIYKRQREESLDFKGIPASSGIYGIHPYPAMFHFMVVRKFIKELTKEGAFILDPFCGSGVSAVEALKNNRNYFGFDINPLAILITKVRTTPIAIESLLKVLDNILKMPAQNYEIPYFDNIYYWFEESVIEELAKLRAKIFKIDDIKIQNFFKVVFSETVRKVSNTDPNEFKLIKRRINKQLDVKKIFTEIAKRNISCLLDISNLNTKSEIFIEQKNVLDGLPIEDESIDLVITSPPYGDSKTTVAYDQFSKLSLKWLGLYDNFEKSQLGYKLKNLDLDLPSEELYKCLYEIEKKDKKRAKEIYSFYYDLYLATKQMSKKVKTGGHVIFVVGNRTVKGIELPTDKICADFFKQYGFIHEITLVRQISNKRMPIQTSPTNIKGQKASTMKYEYIVILKKI